MLPPLTNRVLAVFITQPLVLIFYYPDTPRAVRLTWLQFGNRPVPKERATQTQKTAFNILLTRSKRLWETLGVHENARDILIGRDRDCHQPQQMTGVQSLFLLRGFYLLTFVSRGQRR